MWLVDAFLFAVQRQIDLPQKKKSLFCCVKYKSQKQQLENIDLQINHMNKTLPGV